MEFKTQEELENILGKTIKFQLNPNGPIIGGIAILFNKMHKFFIVHFEPQDGHINPLRPDIDSDWCNHFNFSYVHNIADYRSKHYRQINLDNILEIVENQPTQSIKKNEGCFCSICQQFNPMSEPNQDDGSFKCYVCRVQPLRAYY